MGLFGGSSDVTGYNCQRINDLREVINNTAKSAGNDIVDTMHSDIIVPISSAWYAPEAVNFFDGIKQAVASCGENITEVFDAFRQGVQDAGTNWANNTGGEAPVLATIDTVELNLSISEIQPDNNGNVTIDAGKANSVANSLGDVEQKIKSQLEGLANNLEAETAFIGGNQATLVQECFVKVSGEVHKIFKFLTEGDDSLQSCINKYVEKYAQVSEDVSNSFNVEF